MCKILGPQTCCPSERQLQNHHGYPLHTASYTVSNTISVGVKFSQFLCRQVFSQPFPSHLCRGCVVYPATFCDWCPKRIKVNGVPRICFLSVWWIHTPIQKPNSRTKIKTIKNTLNNFKCIPPLWKAVSRQMTGYTGYTLPERFAIWHHQTVVDYILFSLQLSPPCLFLQWVY